MFGYSLYESQCFDGFESVMELSGVSTGSFLEVNILVHTLVLFYFVPCIVLCPLCPFSIDVPKADFCCTMEQTIK